MNNSDLNSMFEKLEDTLNSDAVDQAIRQAAAENNLLKQRRLKEIQNENIKENLENETKDADQFLYNDGTPFNLDPNHFFYSWIKYFAMIAAHDVLSTKNIDCLVYDENTMLLNKIQTRKLSHLLKADQFEQKLYSLLEQASIDGYSGIALIPSYDKFDKNQKYTLLSNVQIIKMSYLNNEIQAVQVLANNAIGINVPGIWVYITITKNEYKTFYVNDKKITTLDEFKKQFNNLEKKSTQLKDKQAYDFLNNNIYLSLQKLNFQHNLGFVPFLEFKFNQDRLPIIKGISQELTEFFVIEQKKYDECHYAGTKLVSLDANPENENQKKHLIDSQKNIASSAVIMAKSDLVVDDDANAKAKIELYTKNPIIQSFHDASNATLNRILKKLGLSADTDSKGTVQQSKFEMLAQNQASFNFQNFRNVIFQNFIQKIVSMFYILNFNDHDNVKAISSQSLGMTELDKMQYVSLGMKNKLFDKARAFAILTGKDYIDASDILELQEIDDEIVDQENMSEPNVDLEIEENA